MHLFACFLSLSRRIRAGTELTWDYNYEVGSVEGKELLCCCGSTECRGRLLWSSWPSAAFVGNLKEPFTLLTPPSPSFFFFLKFFCEFYCLCCVARDTFLYIWINISWTTKAPAPWHSDYRINLWWVFSAARCFTSSLSGSNQDPYFPCCVLVAQTFFLNCRGGASFWSGIHQSARLRKTINITYSHTSHSD